MFVAIVLSAVYALAPSVRAAPGLLMAMFGTAFSEQLLKKSGTVVTNGQIADEIETRLRRFIERASFGAHGGFITDLDGIVVFESQGTTLFAPEVEHAIKAIYELGRPLMLNTLRFPLSVMRTFGEDWYRLSNAPIPIVSLNGSQIGLVREVARGDLRFDELAAYRSSATRSRRRWRR